MERAAKERLVGAIVLVSVAWLLIPVFLDQSADPPGEVIERQLALPNADLAPGDQPRRRETVKLRDNDVTPPPEEAVLPSLTMPTPDTQGVPAEDTQVDEAQAASAADAPDSDISNGNAVEDRVEDSDVSTVDPAEILAATVPAQPMATRPEPVAEPSPTEQDNSAAQEVPREAAVDGQLWAVQLGSFGDQSNAQKLAASLRADGFPAFISEVESAGKTLHRVRIGPQANRALSEQVVAELKASGQVARAVKYP